MPMQCLELKCPLHHPIFDFWSSTNRPSFCMIKTESEDIYEQETVTQNEKVVRY